MIMLENANFSQSIKSGHISFASNSINLFLGIMFALFIAVNWYLSVNNKQTKLFHAKKSVDLDVYDEESKQLKKISLLELVRKKCPHLSDPQISKFRPTPWLFNGHLQTLWAAVTARSDKRIRVRYQREIIYLPDGGNLALDWCPGPDVVPFDSTPCIILMHGLTGGSHETYIQDLVESLVHTDHQYFESTNLKVRNYRTVVVNFRGCAGTRLTSPRLYNGAHTDDIGFAVDYIRGKVTGSLSLVGFSLGANVIVKYVGEKGKDCPMICAVSVGSPYELHVSCVAMHRTWLGHLYSYVIARNLVSTFEKHKQELSVLKALDPNEITNATTVTEFDIAATAKSFGYRHVNESTDYRDGCSSAYIPDISIPTLLYSSFDDPVASCDAIPFAETRINPNILLAVTPQGGHLGWFSGWKPRRWYQNVVSEFLECIIE
ncbi:hypothetical protein HK096_005586, partial [Nowakowskiella sp. JEL0078]